MSDLIRQHEPESHFLSLRCANFLWTILNYLNHNLYTKELCNEYIDCLILQFMFGQEIWRWETNFRQKFTLSICILVLEESSQSSFFCSNAQKDLLNCLAKILPCLWELAIDWGWILAFYSNSSDFIGPVYFSQRFRLGWLRLPQIFLEYLFGNLWTDR